MKPRIMLAGLGETGFMLATRLCANWEVIGIDPAGPALERLSGHTCGNGPVNLRLHQGDATSALVLRKAGLEGTHTAVACTGSDEVNLEVFRLARELFGIGCRSSCRAPENSKESRKVSGISMQLPGPGPGPGPGPWPTREPSWTAYGRSTREERPPRQGPR
ncbi:MAG: hypothetical protein FJ125_17755 [Deltaproteobacteria bacterium]|nr:hypothetical protein [Deltaproteobacteria bacterium]